MTLTVAQQQIKIISLKHWVIGAVEINNPGWAPSNEQWQLIWNKIKNCEVSNSTDIYTISTYNEFKTWISGIADLLEDDEGFWTPTAVQWKKIFDKLNTIDEDIEVYCDEDIEVYCKEVELPKSQQIQERPAPQFLAPPSPSFIAPLPPSTGKQSGYSSPFGS
jgi:hypothetical protein